MPAHGADVAEAGTTALRKGTVLPLLPGPSGRTAPVTAREDRVEACRRWERPGPGPTSRTSHLQFPLLTAEGVVTQKSAPREQDRTSPPCITNLFGKGLWMEFLFHFLG